MGQGNLRSFEPVGSPRHTPNTSSTESLTPRGDPHVQGGGGRSDTGTAGGAARARSLSLSRESFITFLTCPLALQRYFADLARFLNLKSRLRPGRCDSVLSLVVTRTDARPSRRLPVWTTPGP